ncbi:MAG: HEAT repeat domain-containing protein, partial [Verrucomicrobiae bacterium]|nr:HEAT repeat domain-containing protein [Verrucomicrobiae bacterium]NNJ86484.1 HEAT repeat domain-containing protein [Akkermansiaceae bacterium]
KKILSPAYNPNPISRSLNALALLSTGDEKWLPVVKKEAEWASNYSAFKFSSWYYGHVITFLAEYVMLTGDQSVMPGLRRLAMESVKGQSIVGSWGHRFAGDDGRLVGYGMMNSTGAPLTIALELARRAGVDDPRLPQAIERSAKLLRFYIGKGAVPYGDHHPWIQTHEDNGKCGMAAVLFNLLEEEKGAEFFSRMSLASYGNERDTGHTGNFWNMLWAIPGVNQAGPQATGAWMHEFGSWYFDLARDHNGQFLHQGPPNATPDHTGGWDATGAYLLAYAMPLKKLCITGKYPAATPQLNAEEAQKILEDGRGWVKTQPHRFYDALSTEELLDRLGSWSPVVRERAAIALSRRDQPPIDKLIQMLDNKDLEIRLGVCQTLAQLKRKAEPAVPKLRETLKAEDMWLRIKAADALAAIGKPARVAATDLLKLLIREPGPNDPRAMEQRYLIFALFNNRGGLLSDSLEGIDRDLLKAAVHAGLRNQDGRARLAFLSVYHNLPPEELKEMLPEVHYAALNPAPSGIMFADGIRTEGLNILSEWKVAEGIDACMFYLKNQNHWASEKRTPQLLKVLCSYGVHAKRTIPELKKLADYFAAGNPGYFPRNLSQDKARYVRETIDFLEKTKERPTLISIQ